MLDVLGKVHLFPVRHHSPRTSHVLRAYLDEVRPDLVLVEGPSDCDALVGVLVDPETEPPVAILGYRTDGTPGSSLWPFASYSPEWVALKWATAHGVPARFIDLTVGEVLAADRRATDLEDPGAAGEDEVEASLYQRVAEARGFRSFEEFWEASFEAPAYDQVAFRTALLAYADLVRKESSERDYHAARDAYMAQKVAAAVLSGTPPEKIAVVVGAAHASAFVAGDVEAARAERFRTSVPTASTVIPYSFPRLAEQTGYGAGNRAPRYYQRAHDAGCSFRRATLEVLVELGDHLRMRGFQASLADTLEAYRLAQALADLRGKAEPGLDEVEEASVATMCRGDASHVRSFLWPAVIGHSLGKVASRIGKNSLQEEFWRELDQRRLPRTDSVEQFDLRLSNEVEIGTSIFLHRLRLADVPYAAFLGQKSPAVSGGRAEEIEAAGGVEALRRVREYWSAQWTPATDVALVEKIVLGDSLAQVVERVLEERLTEARNTGDAAEVLLEAVTAAIPGTLAHALSACDGFAVNDTDLASLAKGAHALSSLVGSGRTRRLQLTEGGAAIPELLATTFSRAVLRVDDGCTGDDEAVVPAMRALRALHEIALAQPLVDQAAWLAAARRLVDSYVVNPGCAGLACGLAYLARALSDEDVATIVAQRLSDTLQPARAAGFLAGFFSVNALVLVKNRSVVAALDGFLANIDREHFRDALPMLRRAFASLGATERRYLLEHVLALRNLGGQVKAAKAIITEEDKEKVKEAVKDLGDLDDLL